MDATGLTIAAGTVAAVAFAAVKAWKQRQFDAGQSALVFLGVIGVTVGCQLIYCAFKGDSGHLPVSWREYLGVAGVVSAGLSCDYLFKTFREAWKPGTTESGVAAVNADLAGKSEGP